MSACGLCGRATRDGAAYCCRGCAEVHAIFVRNGWEIAPTPAPATPGPEAPLTLRRYAIRGLWCPSCAWGLERYLRRYPGVASARVDYLTASCEVWSSADDAELRRRITALGFAAVAEGGGWDESGGLALRASLALFLGMGAMALSWSGYLPALRGASAAGNGLLTAIAALAATLVVWVCGWPILRGGWLGLRHGAANMDTLIATSGLAAFGLSVVEWTRGRLTYFDVPAMLFAFLLAGRWLEFEARRHGGRDWERWQAAPEEAAARLAAGDRVLLRPAERIPADCRLQTGAALVDESLLTGEARPVRRESGAELAGGSLVTAILGGEPAYAEVLRPAAASRLAELSARVDEARRARAGSRQAQRLDSWAAYFVPAVVAAAAVTLAGNWAWGAGAATAWLRAIAVLILACPCTLGLALPLVEERGVTLAARRGILVQDLDALLALDACDTVVLDKTGTATEGGARISAFACVSVAQAATAAAGGGSAPAAAPELAIAAALEAGSPHPTGEAIRAFAAARNAGLAGCDGVAAIAGQGVRGWRNGLEWRLGRAAFAAPAGLPPELEALAAAARAAGDSVVVLSRGGVAHALFALRDRPRAGAAAVLSRWRRKRELWLVSGDEAAAVAATARQLGIAKTAANRTPEQKAHLVAALRTRGRRVAAIGDGHNDAPALAAATAGIAVSRGALLPCRAAGITLLTADFALLDAVFRLARQLRRRERFGLGWAAIYNLAGLPLAAIGWIGPLAAALAMVASSLSLLTVALRPFSALKP